MPQIIEKITSRKNPLIIKMSKLGERKRRDEVGLFRIDGKKLFAEAKNNGVRIEYVFAMREIIDSIAKTYSIRTPLFLASDRICLCDAGNN